MTSYTTPDHAITAAFALGHLVEQRAALDSQILDTVARVLDAGGSWTTVGVALGVSRQAAHERYANLV